MKVSKQVEDSIKDAIENLRNALAFAARGERANVCSEIADMIQKIDALRTIDEIMDKLENRKEGDSGTWGPIVE